MTKMIGECDAIRPIRDVADAARHRILTRNTNQRTITTATTAWTSENDYLTYNSIDGQYDGKRFDEIVKPVFLFWDSWIGKNFPENSLRETVKPDYLE
ncbi:MAG: hypothetical protein H7841_17465 [Magnetospirillum sp. WYHS-4]